MFKIRLLVKRFIAEAAQGGGEAADEVAVQLLKRGKTDIFKLILIKYL